MRARSVPHRRMSTLLVCVGILGCGRVGFGDGDDAGVPDASSDSGLEAATDAGVDSGVDAEADAGPGYDLTTPFTVVGVLTELGLEGAESPTTTPDQLELYFQRAGEIFLSTRSNRADAWGTPAPVNDLNATSADDCPALSPDGLTIYFGSERSPPLERDMFFSTRSSFGSTWTVPTIDAELSNSGSSVSPVGITDDGLEAFARMNGAIFSATRRRTDVLFGELVGHSELRPGSESLWDAWIDPAGLLIVVPVGATTPERRLHFAVRNSREAPFGSLIPVQGLGDDEAGDPWLSPDLRTLYFVRDRKIVVATR